MRIFEQLEPRLVPTPLPLTLADPSYFGAAGSLASGVPSVSDDGQLVAFESNADNLVPNDTNGLADVFLYDRARQTVSLISVGPGGTAGGGSAPIISPDGRYIAFESNSRGILPTFQNDGVRQIFLRDLQNATTSLLSIASNGVGGSNASSGARFSGNSRYAGFISEATNLVSGVTIASVFGGDVYLRDLQTSTTKLISISQDGAASGDAASEPFALSHDGRFVVFESSASNLVSQPNNAIEQIYLRDTLANTTRLVSRDVTGLNATNGHTELSSTGQAISADGRFIVFHSTATNIVSTPSGGANNSYLTDTQTGTTVLLSAALDGRAVQGNRSEVVSPDGRWAAFAIGGDNIAGPTNGLVNVYVRNISTGQLTMASVNAAGTAGGNAGSGLGTFFDFPGGLSFSPSGRYLAFRSMATDLVPGSVQAGHRNLYARDLNANTTILLSRDASGGDGGNGDTDTALFSAEDRVVVFQGTSSNLVAGDGNRVRDVFVRDLTTNQTALASIRSPLLPESVLANRGGQFGERQRSVSADGRYVVFISGFDTTTTDLDPSLTKATAGGVSAFVRDRVTGDLLPVDIDPQGVLQGVRDFGVEAKPTISANGRFVAFPSSSQNLVPGIDYSGTSICLFVRDLQTGTTRIASVDPTGTKAIDVIAAVDFSLSDDGRFVVFGSNSATPFPGIDNPNRRQAIFLRDFGDTPTPATTVLVSHNLANNGTVGGNSRKASMTGDGRYVLFMSEDVNLAANDANSAGDVFRFDRVTGNVALVSVNATGTAPGDLSSDAAIQPVMSADGRFVAFASSARNLTGVATTFTNIFRRDMETNTTVLVSINRTGTGQGNQRSIDPSISAAGDRIVFVSAASDLTTIPRVGNADNIYLRDFTANTTSVISINAAGTATGTGSSSSLPVISPDGRYVAFLSNMNDLAPGFADGNGASARDLYLRDTQIGATRAVSINQSGTFGNNAANGDFHYQFLSNSSQLLFETAAPDLFVGDRNRRPDLFETPTAGFGVIGGGIFRDLNSDGIRDANEVGVPHVPIFVDRNLNGRLDRDEFVVVADAAGNYALTGLPAGTHRVSIVTPPGLGISLPTDGSRYDVNLPTATSTAVGRDFGLTIPFVDISVESLSVPATAEVGGELTVTWTVKNVGTGDAAIDWQDAVYLTPANKLDDRAILLHLESRPGGLPAKESYTESAAVEIPPVQPGNYRIIVRSDRRRQVTTDATLANNTRIANATSLQVPELTLGVPATREFSGPGQQRFFQVTSQAGSSLLLQVAGNHDDARHSITARRSFLPNALRFDFTADAGADPFLVIPAQDQQTWYIKVRNEGVTSGPFTITASQPGTTVLAATPHTIGNQSTVTLEVQGIDLQPGMRFQLRMSNVVREAQAARIADSTRAFVTFDMSGAPVGTYDVEAFDPQDNKTTLAAQVQVVAGIGGRLESWVVAPPVVRTGRIAQFYIEYENTGDADMPAPIFLLYSPTNTPLGFRREEIEPGKTPIFLGSNPDGAPGLLRPGERVRIPIYFNVPVDGGDLTDTDAYEFQLNYFDHNDASPIDWGIVKTWLTENENTLPNFGDAFAALQRRVGPSWGDLVRKVSHNLTLLDSFRSSADSLFEPLDLEMSFAIAEVTTSIVGRVAAGDRSVPIAGRTVIATGRYGHTYSTTTLTDGTFVFNRIQPDIYSFRVVDLQVTPIESVRVFPNNHLQQIVLEALPGLTLSGRVLGKGTAVAVTNPEIVVMDESNNVYRPTLGANGAYRFPGLHPGKYKVQSTASDRAPTFLPDLVIGDSNVAFDIEMAAEGTITGQAVVIQTGGPTNPPLRIQAFPAGTQGGYTPYQTTSNVPQFTLHNLPAGTYDLLITAPDYVSQQVLGVVVTEGGNTVIPQLILLTYAGRISGRIETANSSVKVGNRSVVLFDQQDQPIASTFSRTDGTYSFGSVPSGNYTIRVNAENLADSVTATVTQGNTTNVAPITIHSGATIEGTIRDPQGNPLRRIPVSIYAANGQSATTATNDEGQFRQHHLAAGTYVVVVPGATTNLQLTASGADDEILVATITAPVVGHISGRVLDGDGQPLPYSAVQLLRDGFIVAQLDADSNGTYDFAVTSPGTFELQAIRQQYAFPPVGGLVISDGTSLQQDLVASLHSFEIQLTGPAQNIANALVTIARETPNSRAIIGTYMADDTGLVRLQSMIDGQYLLVARGSGNMGGEGRFTLNSPGGNGNFNSSSFSFPVAQQGALGGTIDDEQNAPVGDATVTLRSVTGIGVSTATTAANGSYSVSSLTPGVYDVTVTAPGHEPVVSRSVSLGLSNAPFDGGLRVARSFVTGAVIVRDPFNGRQLVPNASVILEDSFGNVVATSRSLNQGRFKLPIEPGTGYKLYAVASGFRTEERLQITVVLNETTDLGDIEMVSQSFLQAEEPDEVIPFIPHIDFPPPPPRIDFPDFNPIPPPNWGDDEIFDPPVDVGPGPFDFPEVLGPVDTPVPSTDSTPSPNPHPDCPDHCQGILDKIHQIGDEGKKAGKQLEDLLKDLAGTLPEFNKKLQDHVQGLISTFLSTFGPAFGGLAEGLAETKIAKGLADAGALANILAGIQGAGSAYKDFLGSITDPKSFRPETISSFALNFLGALTGIMAGAAHLTGFGNDKWSKAIGNLNDLAGLAQSLFGGAQELQESFENFRNATIEVQAKMMQIARLYDQLQKALQELEDCRKQNGDKMKRPTPPPGQPGPRGTGAPRGAFDPNEILGPTGFGEQLFITAQPTLPYTVLFENDPNVATAPAQEVVITQTLDGDLDWTTFELGSVGFGSFIVDVPPGLQSYSTRVNFQNEDGSPLFVDVEAGLDLVTGIVTWTFRSVDPETGELPEGVFDGFLPVNDETARGEGFAQYSVRSKSTLATGTTINAQASIVFDVNQPVITNTFTNTIDAGPPASAVAALPANAPGMFEVSWSGGDDAGGPPGSGIAFFDVFVSDNGAPYSRWQDQTAATSAQFTGVDGHTYRFYSVAVDQVGNAEPPAASFDTEVLVVAFPWRNTRNARDVNNDGFVVPQDALIVINELNTPTIHDDAGKLPTTRPDTARFFYDVTGDGFCVPGDVLSIINFLNGGSGGEGEPIPDSRGVSRALLPFIAAIQLPSDSTDRFARPDRSHIDERADRSPAVYLPDPPLTDAQADRQPHEGWESSLEDPEDLVEISDDLVIDVIATRQRLA